MTTRQEQKEKTRRALLDAAIELSRDRGFSSLSLREVTTHAGKTPNTFYRHFESMEELGFALIKEFGITLQSLIEDARFKNRTSRSDLHGSIAAFMNYLNSNEGLFRLVMGERWGRSVEFRKACQNEMQRFVVGVMHDLEDGGRATGVTLADPQTVAELMSTLVFNLGVDVIDCAEEGRKVLADKMISQLRLIMIGARTVAKGSRTSL